MHVSSDYGVHISLCQLALEACRSRTVLTKAKLLDEEPVVDALLVLLTNQTDEPMLRDQERPLSLSVHLPLVLYLAAKALQSRVLQNSSQFRVRR